MDKLTLGVIGAGTWAIAQHLPAFARRSDVVPLIVNRRDPVLLQGAKERFGFAQASTDWHDVIAARPDLVVLTGPVGPRAEQARAALEARNKITWAIDSGLTHLLVSALGMAARLSGVSMVPGRMQLTLMPFSRTSAAMLSVSRMTAALEAE